MVSVQTISPSISIRLVMSHENPPIRTTLSQRHRKVQVSVSIPHLFFMVLICFSVLSLFWPLAMGTAKRFLNSLSVQ